MMTRKELMRSVNQIAHLRASNAYQLEKQRLIAELRQVAAARGDVEQHLAEAQRAAAADMLRRAVDGSATSTRTSTRDARASARPAGLGPNPPVPRAARVREAKKKPGEIR